MILGAEDTRPATGHFQLAYYDVRKGERRLKIRLPKNQKKNRFSLKLDNGVAVDLDEGQLQVPASLPDAEVVQSVGMAFTVATMYLLVHPKPHDLPGN